LTFEDREAFKRNYQKALIYLTLVSIPLVLTIFFLSDSLVIFFFGPTFANSAPSLKILILAVPFIFINYVLINTLIVLNQGKIITWGSGLALIFNIVINIIILPGYGYLGASWTTVATEALISICFLGFLQSFFFNLPLMGFLLKLGVSGGLMGLSLWGLKSCPSAVAWSTAFVAYGLGLVLFRLVTREDWRFLKQILTQPLAEPGVKAGVES
jgi:O-antigen/teichoic acid export membrane protein